VPGGRARQLLKPRATVVEEAVVSKDTALCIPLDLLNNNDVEYVGGKSASLGEMISGLASADVPVPGGFSTTAHAYRQFLAQDGYTLLSQAQHRHTSFFLFIIILVSFQFNLHHNFYARHFVFLFIIIIIMSVQPAPQP